MNTLATITDATSLADAFATAFFGQHLLIACLIMSAILIVLPTLGIIFKDERFVHAARKGQYLLFALTGLAAATLLTMIFGGMYVTGYVSNVSELNEAVFYKIAGLWAGQQGSLLFWCLILNLFGVVFAFSNRHTRTDRRLPATLFVLAIVQCFFLSLLQLDFQSPFALVIDSMADPEFAGMTIRQLAEHVVTQGWPEGLTGHVQWMIENSIPHTHLTGSEYEAFLTTPLAELQQQVISASDALPAPVLDEAIRQFGEGNGLNPQLHNPWIAIHPPVLYLGYIGFTIPFCYAVGSLISGELDAAWIRRARIWTMGAWVFLTAGIAMGGLWAYEILGWGGYWAWDPVENASFVPWLVATAFIHSVIVQERRGMFKAWNVALIIMTYCLTVLGTFLVRSGIIESVHSFADTGLKTPLLVFFIIVFLIPLLLVVYRYPLLKSSRGLDSLLSREAVFLGNNLLLTLLAGIVLAMTLWPALTETLLGEAGKHQWGQQAYNVIATPLFLLMIFFTAAGPLLHYGRTSKQVLIKQFTWPLVAFVAAASVNAWFVISFDHLTPLPNDGDTIVILAALSGQLAQFALPPLVVMVITSVLQEILQAASIRKRATKESASSATMSVLLANRRRYGGYICHIGLAFIAAGIFLSSSYDYDSAEELIPGGYALIDDDWVLVYDQKEETPLYRYTSVGNVSGPVKKAVETFLREPTQSVEDILTSAANSMGTSVDALPPKMREGLEKASQVYEQKQVAFLTVQLWRNPDITLEGYLAYARTSESPERRAQSERIYARAKELQDAPRAVEEYRASVLFFAVTPSEIAPSQRQAFLNAYQDAFEKKAASAQYEEDFDKVARLGVEIGPQVLSLLKQRFEDERSAPLIVRAFNNELSRRIFTLQKELTLKLAKQAANTNDERAQEARNKISLMSFQALSGLRELESHGSDDEKAYAQSALTELFAQAAGTLTPGIKVHRNKLTGEPRPGGTQMDPSILSLLEADLYVILQDVHFADYGDLANFRVHIKPAMHLARLGLVVMILGALFALLPRRRTRIKPTI